MKTKQKLYFAYGSNLLRSQMMRRCPHCYYMGIARLPRWKFQYDGTCDDWSNMAVGNIVESPRDEVWGALYSLCASDIRRLDGYEDYPTDYVRLPVSVYLQPLGTKQEVFVYARLGQKTGSPSQEYEHTILVGASEDGLPEKYVKKYLAV